MKLEVRLYWEMYANRTRSNGHKLDHGRLQLDRRILLFFFSPPSCPKGGQILENVAQKVVETLSLAVLKTG